MSAWPVTPRSSRSTAGGASRSACPGPATPTCRASSSTATTTSATCSSGPAPARRRRGSPAGAVAKALLPRDRDRGALARAAGRHRAGDPAGVALSSTTSSAPSASEVRCLDPAAEAAMIDEIEAAKRERDTLGGVTEVRAFGVPPGLGSHVVRRRPARRPDRGGDALDPVRQGRRDRRRDRLGRPPRSRACTTRSCTPTTAGYHRETDRAGGLEGGMTNGAERRRAGDLEAAADPDAAAAQRRAGHRTSRARPTSSAAT